MAELPISLPNLKLEDDSVDGGKWKTFYQFVTVVADIPIPLRNALEGFDKADGTLDSQVMSLHNLVHSFLNGTNALPHSAANDPIFVVSSKPQHRWKIFYIICWLYLLFNQIEVWYVFYSRCKQWDVCLRKLTLICTIGVVREHLKSPYQKLVLWKWLALEWS